MKSMFRPLRSLATREEGAQVLEYGLIVAVIALAMLLALRPVGDSGWWGSYLTRLSNCFIATCA